MVIVQALFRYLPQVDLGPHGGIPSTMGKPTREDLTLFPDLPAGEYQVKVYDSKGCPQDGPVLTITQPEELLINVVSTADITPSSDGHIEVEASGGTIPYTYMLLPD